MFVILFVARNAELILLSLFVFAFGGVAMFHLPNKGKVANAIGGIFFTIAAAEIVLFAVAIPYLPK